jgi:hypothetical protein
MKKSKLITTLLLVVILLVAFSSVLVACDPKEDGPGSGGNSGGLPPTPPSGPGNNGEVPKPYYEPLELLEKIVNSIDTPEKVLGIDVSIDCDTPDGKKTRVGFKTNIKDKYHNEISLIVDQQSLGQTNFERVFGLYMLNDKMFVDLGEGKSMLYLEDFNPNYIVELVQQGIIKLPELLGDIDIMGYINGFLPLIMPILFSEPVVTVTEEGGQDIVMAFDIKGLLQAVPEILSAFVTLPVKLDLGVLVGYLAGLMPDGTYQLQSNFDENGELTYLGIDIDDNITGDHTGLEINVEIKDSAVDTEIPEIDENDLVNFSFTNIQFSIDLMVGTQDEPVLDENGDPVIVDGKPAMKKKQLDVGKVINELLGGTGILPQDFNLPSNLLLLQGGTGLRLSFAIDLDLNYKKEPVDNNKIAIELYLLDENGKQIGTMPQAGIYYTQGSLYINLDNLLPNYLQNVNLRVDTDLSKFVSALVNMITEAIDKALGTDFEDIVNNSGAKIESDGTVTVNTSNDLDRILSTADADVLACSFDDSGRYVVSPGVKNLVTALATALGFQECITFEGSRIIITADNEHFLASLASFLRKDNVSDLGFKFPDAIPEVRLTINLFEGGLESIAVDATVDSALDVEVKIHDFLIGIEDTGLDERIEQGINKENTSYLNSLSSVIDTILSGIVLKTHFNMTFNRGRYNLAPLIASFGLPQIAESDIIWEFTDEFVLDASINIQIALNRENPTDSTFVFELKTEKGIIIGQGEEGIKFAPGTVLLGIYGYRNSVYIDLSGFKIANITLPKLKFDLRFSEVIYSLIDDVVAKLLTSMNIEGGDLIFNFDLGDLIGLPTAPAANGAIATAADDSAPSLKQELAAIILGVSTDAITPIISMASILAVIKQIDSGLIDESLNEALELMEVNLGITMGREDGFTFDFTGNLIPIMIDYEEDANGVKKDSICVFYYDKDGNQLPTHDANGKKIVYKNTTDKKQYEYKRYNYTNKDGNDSGFHLLFEAGTEDYPIKIGEIPADHKFNFADKAKEFDQYKSDLVQAIMDTVGTGELDLTLRLLTKDNKMNLTQMINTILASVGKRLEIPINLNLDEWETDVKLLLQWDIDLTSSARSAIKLELQYRGKIVMGVYVYRNNFIINLEGLGLFSAELVNTTIINRIFEMLSGYINQIENLDLNKIIADLLENAGLPTLPGAGGENDDVATDDNMPTIGENLPVMDLVKYLLQAVSLEDTSIALNFTSTLINTLLNELLGINLGIDFTVSGNLDLFGNEFGIDIGVEDIEVKATLALNIGGEVDIRVDYENIPDWDATNGRTLAKTMLDNIDLGLTLDLANNTSDARAVQGGNAGYTRIRIWKAGNNDRLTGTADNARVPKGNIIVGIYQIDKIKFDDNTATNGYSKPIAYLVLDYDAGKLLLTLAKNVITVGPAIDIGNYVKNMEINVDLLGMLEGVFDGLLKQIDGIFDNLNTQLTSPQQLATADGEGEGEESDIDKFFKELFADFDVTKLLSPGIEVSLKSNGNFNVDIAFDPYTINKLIDDVLGGIFSRGTGKPSVLNLQKLAPDMFTQDHLSKVTWTRMVPGADGNLDSFWGSLRATVPDLLTDVVKGLGINFNIGALDGLLGGIYNQVSVLIRSLLPFAVFNEFHVGLNIIDATIANVSIVGRDHNQNIYDENGGIAYGESDARGAENFTQIWVYNMFKSVGDPSNAIPGVTGSDAQGVVTWTDIPSRIDYAPYTYESDQKGVETIIAKHFTGKTARYQDGATGSIIKKDVNFYLKKYRYNDNDPWINYPENTPVSDLNLSLKGTYIVEARATFGQVNRKMEITINALGDGGGGIEKVDSFSMHVYDPLPDFISVRMKDGTTRKIRINEGGVQVLNKDGTGPVMPEKYGENHTVDAWVRFPRVGQADLPVKVEYLDSSVSEVIVNGEAISAKDGKVASVIIDLYNYTLSKESSITDYISDVFYFKYKDGKAVGMDVNGEWQYDPEEVAKFYERLVNEETGFSEDVSGTAFAVRNTIGNGATEQEVVLMIWVKTKKVNKLTIGGLENTLRVDPYQYYMYLITGDESINPFPTTATATYYDTYKSPINEGEMIIDNDVEDVSIVWNEEDYRGVDFSWDNNNSGGKDDVWVYLDNSKYDGNFTWKFKTRIVVLRNEIQAVYFDDELTQSTYFIDPFEYLLKKSHGMTDEEIYPSEANILFTNGSVRKMPIQWVGLDKFNIIDYSSRVTQLQVKIGYDIDNKLANVIGDLEQTAYVNVKVDNLMPDGLDVAGSEYSIKNKGEATFYIDPIQVLYYGMNPFPETVKMVYKDGKTSDLNADWIFNETITMQGRKGLKATVYISEEYQYPINVEIIDRTNLKAANVNIKIDPYKYKTDENGSRIYSDFTPKSYIYKLIGNIDYKDLANIKVEGLNKVSGNVSDQFNTYVQYEVEYIKNGKNEVYTARDIDLIADFFEREGNAVTILSAVAKEYFEVNVEWDLTEINYAISDTYTVKMISKALESQYDRTFRISVEVVAKKVEYVGRTDYSITIDLNGTNLTEEENLTKTLLRNLYVAFDDETYGNYDCTIDLSDVNFGYYDVMLVNEFEVDGVKYRYRDRSGNPVAETDIASKGTDVTVTVCSGDIAQRVTIKAVVIFENIQTA